MQVSQSRKYCEYEIEFLEDPDIVVTEIRQCAYREYDNVRNELESTECESSKYEQNNA